MATHPPPERRKSQRIAVTSVGPRLQPPHTLRDISTGGFSVESLSLVAIGERETFEFTIAGHPPIVLTGSVRHSMRLNHADGSYTFLSGFEFEGMTAERAKSVGLLLKEIGNALGL
jgi:hypothetical protein